MRDPVQSSVADTERNPSDDLDLEQFQARFENRYRIKKIVNAVLCFIVTFCGVSAVLYSVFINGMDLFDRLRYMTFNGTIFTSAVSLVFGVICLIEASSRTEVTYKAVYFLRLSSAVTELVILAVVLFGLTPLVPDEPDIFSYTGCMMHFVIPVITLLSFSLNDAPIGRLKPLEPFYGSWFITVYAAVVFVLFATHTLPSEQAPYSFLDFDHATPIFIIGCLLGIYAAGYLAARLLSYLNRKLSWVWFYDLHHRKERR